MSSISAAASIMGMQVSMSRHDITANDVSNVNTPGYEEKTAIQTDVYPEGVRIASIRSTPNPAPQFSGTDLATESVEQIQNKGSLSANISVIKAKDKMLGELLDLMA